MPTPTDVTGKAVALADTTRDVATVLAEQASAIPASSMGDVALRMVGLLTPRGRRQLVDP
jgi:hypothetical protein